MSADEETRKPPRPHVGRSRPSHRQPQKRASLSSRRRVVASAAMGTVRVGEFEWNDAKATANLRKHGVTFEEAMTVFLDELAVPFEEGEHPDRLILVGESQLGRTILVVFTERLASARIRIISARRATKRERRAYVEGD